MENSITCPSCSTAINVEQILVHKLKAEFSGEFQKKQKELETQFNNRQKELEKKESVLADEKLRQDRIISQKLLEKEELIKNEVKLKIQQENEHIVEALKKDNLEKSQSIITLQAKEADLLKQQRELEEQKSAMVLEVERTLSAERKSIEEKIQKREQESHFFKLQEKEHLISDMRKQMEDMKRKIEQGSMQVQGEVMEVELERILKESFPFDEIQEVSKGANGADIIHCVKNHIQANCGKIVFESKRTKSFSAGWIDKLKSDMRQHKAQIGVLVTEVMPKEMTQFGMVDGVWVCSFQEAIALVTVLRYSLLTLHDQKVAEENKGEKQQLLYNYLTSVEFAQHIEVVLSGFTVMQSTLEKEKKAYQRLWKEREKQIEAMLDNTIDIYGAIKGIAGSSIKEIKALDINQLLISDKIEE